MPSEQKGEDVPLSEGKTSHPLIIEEKQGYFFSKTKIIAAIVAVVVLVIIIIILAAFLGAAKSSMQKEKVEGSPTQLHTPLPTSIPPTTAGTEAWWNPRLPANIIPKHYNLLLNITVDLPSFDGRVDIDVEVKSATDLIILHSQKMNISLVEIKSRGKESDAVIQNHFSFPKYDYYVIQTKEPLQPGRYLVKLVFEVFFSDGVVGMYRSSFKRASDGQEVYYAATQFEDLHARKAFPCFDEPALKSTFNVTIAHRSDYIALCNMPIYKTETINGQKLDHFSRSVLMPTYLLAFVVGDFRAKQGVSKNNITMGYFSRPSYAQSLDFALSVGGKIMTYFEDLFDVKYSLPKEDMVAVPKFGAGAMENWGLILYREKYLLWNPKESTEKNKMDVAAVMTHELVHMWFGNIVTLNWWNDIWLNEGFAKYFDTLGRDIAEPEWKKVDKGICHALWQPLLFDSRVISNPISENPKSIRSTREMSGTIFYDKASCVLHMMQGFLGQETFISGLRIYLKRHAFGNTVTDDLWKALTEATCKSGKCMDIKQIMDTWTLQMGYPVVKFTKKNATHYTVSQTHFRTSRNATYRKSDFGYTWVIPLTYVIKDQGERFIWMNRSSVTIKWDGKGWIKGNTGHKGFYLTNYDEENWKALAEQLNANHTVFSSSDRAGLLVDLEILLGDIRKPKIEYSTAFLLTEYMKNETDYLPWRSMLHFSNDLQKILPRTSKAYKYLMKYMVFLGSDQYNRLGFLDTGSSPDKFLRGEFLKLFCEAKVESCTKRATELFGAWMDNPNARLPPNLRKVVYYYGVAYGGLEEWDFLYGQYNKTKNSEVKANIMHALAASREPWIIERYLRYLSDPFKFSMFDRYDGFDSVLDTNPFGAQIIWGFVRTNWERLVVADRNILFHVVSNLVSTFDTQFMLEEFQNFVAQKSSQWPKDIYDKSKEEEKEIKERIEWLDKNREIIEETLEKLLTKNKVL